jgi:hypothetical protein
MPPDRLPPDNPLEWMNRARSDLALVQNLFVMRLRFLSMPSKVVKWRSKWTSGVHTGASWDAQ